jgi:hypothetical protein
MKEVNTRQNMFSLKGYQDGEEIKLSFPAIWSTCNVMVGSHPDELCGIEVAIQKVVRYLGPAK